MTEPAEEDAQLHVEDQRFAIVPEWMIDTPVSDSAFRLYVVLLRYGATSGCRMPSRKTLARRLHKRSVDSVDRALKELVTAGAVVVERRRDGTRNLTNRYHVRTSGPGRSDAATSSDSEPDGSQPSVPGSTDAATHGRSPAATPGRRSAATRAADLRHDRESSTENPAPPGRADRVLASQCREVRAHLGLDCTRWHADGVATARLRSGERGWPVERFEAVLLAVAQDPSTRGPLRVAEGGPWWDPPAPPPPAEEDMSRLEAALDELDGLRVVLQREARRRLAADGQALTKAAVLKLALLIHAEGGALTG